jgi:hypothetical protein
MLSVMYAVSCMLSVIISPLILRVIMLIAIMLSFMGALNRELIVPAKNCHDKGPWCQFHQHFMSSF